MLTRTTALALVSFAVGCAGAGGQPAREPSAPSDSTASSSPTEPPPSGGESKTPASSATSSSSSPTELPDAPPATNVGFDFHGWCYDHGVEANLAVDGCEPSGFGKAPADAIWCGRHEDSNDGVAIYFQTLWIVRAKKLVKLADIPVAAGTLALVDANKSDRERMKVKLKLERADDGVTFSEEPGEDCAHATEENKDTTQVDPKLGAKLGPLIQKVCAARGRYRWNGAALSKVSSKP